MERAILQHWAMAAYQLEHGYPNGAGSSSSRLNEIIDALLDLDEMEGLHLPKRLTVERQMRRLSLRLSPRLVSRNAWAISRAHAS
jgi:hypothetical protein